MSKELLDTDVDLLDIRKSFENSPFFSLVGFEVVRLEEGNVKIKLLVRDELLNANNTLHGGVHATMLDTIMGMSARSLSKTRCTTINLNVNYLSPTKGGEVFAIGKVLNQGYRIVAAEGELVDGEGNLLAKATGTFKLIR